MPVDVEAAGAELDADAVVEAVVDALAAPGPAALLEAGLLTPLPTALPASAAAGVACLTGETAFCVEVDDVAGSAAFGFVDDAAWPVVAALAEPGVLDLAAAPAPAGTEVRSGVLGRTGAFAGTDGVEGDAPAASAPFALYVAAGFTFCVAFAAAGVVLGAFAFPL